MVNGLPPLSSDTYLDGFDVLFASNMRITSAGHGHKRRDTLKLNHRLSIYWRIMMNKSYNK